MENKYIKENNSKKRVEILIPIEIYKKFLELTKIENLTVSKKINQLIKDNINKM